MKETQTLLDLPFFKCRSFALFCNNTSGYKGVVFHKNRWQAQIVVDGKKIYLGVFTDKCDAARAYNEAALKYRGKDAIVNESSSGYKGVHRSRKKWHARITVNGRYTYLGTFTDKLDAARAYNAAAIRYHGESAILNVIPETSASK